jgi:Rrf2 family iron-sulfur cluster assembly transcriptional regulator
MHQGPNGTPIRRVDIGQRQHFSQDYLEQLLVKLREAGIVEAVRGPGGGYRLSKKPEDITVWSLVHAVEHKIGYTPCSTDDLLDCEHEQDCTCKNIWVKLKRTVVNELESITVADIMNGNFVS